MPGTVSVRDGFVPHDGQRNTISIKRRVNDRGPFIKGRIIDVSTVRRALGMIEAGVVKVRIEPAGEVVRATPKIEITTIPTGVL